MNCEERKLEAWKMWLVCHKHTDLSYAESDLENTKMGRVFSNAWDAAMVYAKGQLEDFIQDALTKPQKSVDVSDLEVFHLPLGVRSYNCLRAEEIKTIRDLLRYSENDLLRVPNMGRKSVKEIVEVLASMGLKLKDRSPPVVEGSLDNKKDHGDRLKAYSNECRVRRLGIYNQYKHENKTVRELADLYGVTPGRIHQIIKRAEREIKRKNDALPSIESLKAMKGEPPPWLRKDQVNEPNPN